MLGSCPSFPATAIFNTRVDDTLKFPKHGSSDAWVGAIGGTRALHADWGTDESNTSATHYGIPVNLLAATTPETDWPVITFATDSAPDESDCAVADGNGGYAITADCTSKPAGALRFPYPRDAVAKVEGYDCPVGPGQGCDRHVLVVEQSACRLWESYSVSRTQLAGQWSAYSTAAWNLASNTMRPDGWTSAEAAGLPIAPLLVRESEASAGVIAHALRVTFRDSVLTSGHVWPARHGAGGSGGSIPFGALLRLHGDFAIPASWTTQAKAIAVAMQRYGLYVADIGSDLYVQGDPSVHWNGSTISQIQQLHMGDFEFVDLGAVTGDARFSADSYQASW